MTLLKLKMETDEEWKTRIFYLMHVRFLYMYKRATCTPKAVWNLHTLKILKSKFLCVPDTLKRTTQNAALENVGSV